MLADLREFWLYLSVMGWWLVLAGLVLGGQPLAALVLLALPVVGMVVKKRSLLQGCYSVVSWGPVCCRDLAWLSGYTQVAFITGGGATVAGTAVVQAGGMTRGS